MDTAKYWVHVVYPHDEDQGPQSSADEMTVYISLPVPWPSARAHKSELTSPGVILWDATGKKLTVKSKYMDSRMTVIKRSETSTTYQSTGWYNIDESITQDEGVDLRGVQLSLLNVKTMQTEIFEYVESGRGPQILFRKVDGKYELVKGWQCIHPDVYKHTARWRREQDAYQWGYQRHAFEVPAEAIALLLQDTPKAAE
jgi:hypothetical protein